MSEMAAARCRPVRSTQLLRALLMVACSTRVFAFSCSRSFILKPALSSLSSAAACPVSTASTNDHSIGYPVLVQPYAPVFTPLRIVRRTESGRHGSVLCSSDSSAQLLSSVAEIVLRSRLRSPTRVAVEVQSTLPELLSGSVRGVRVWGRDWCTPLRLSCRSLDVRVGSTAIDGTALFATRRILLQKPAMGSAIMRFTATDWLNFLRHPLFDQAVASQSPPTRIDFGVPGQAEISADGIRFPLRWGGVLLLAELTQPRGAEAVVRTARAVVAKGLAAAATSSAAAATSSAAATSAAASGATRSAPRLAASLPASSNDSRDAASADAIEASSRWLSSYFNSLELDLDGTGLRFRNLKTVVPRPGAARELELELSVCVRRFPSPAINF